MSDDESHHIFLVGSRHRGGNNGTVKWSSVHNFNVELKLNIVRMNSIQNE